jgi:hypothetical protein
MLLSTKNKILIYGTLVCCVGIYQSKAMEQEASDAGKVEEEQVSSLQNLPLDLKAHILSFLVSAKNEKEALQNIKYLAASSKEFYTIINDSSILGRLIPEISERFNSPLFYIAIAFRNLGASSWLKEYSQKNKNIEEILDKQMLVAAQAGNSILTQFFLNAGANVNKEDNYGITPLHWAADSGKKDIVKLLLNAGANVNAANSYGSTPLYRAATNGHKEVVELLLNANADINKTDMYGRTPLCLASLNGRKSVVELLRKFGAEK